MSAKISVTIWNEFLHEKSNPAVQKHYPRGIHHAIADALSQEQDLTVRVATLEEPEHGLTKETLDATDTLFWWGHRAHEDVSDEIVERVHQRVLEGMGLVALHSAHYSKIFRRLMGANCSLRWREAAEKERLWNLAPSHPLTEGIGEYIELPREEMYGERFDIPEPETLCFVSWFQGGEVFRSGATWRRGHGRIVYFRPGHETYPTYHNTEIQQVLKNAARWTRQRYRASTNHAPNTKPLEPLGDS